MGSGVMASRPVAPSPLRSGAWRAISRYSSGEALGRAQVELLRRLVVLVDGPARGAAELHGPRHDGREHRLELERRADGLTHLAQRRELADRAGQRRRPLLQLVEQPRVLDGDDGLVGEGLQQLDLAGGEGPGSLRWMRWCRWGCRPPEHRHAEHAPATAPPPPYRPDTRGPRRTSADLRPRRACGQPAPRPGNGPGARVRAPKSLQRLGRDCVRYHVQQLAVETVEARRSARRTAAPRSRTMVSNTGWTSVCDWLIARRISLVAVCRSRASLQVARCVPPAP